MKLWWIVLLAALLSLKAGVAFADGPYGVWDPRGRPYVVYRGRRGPVYCQGYYCVPARCFNHYGAHRPCYY